jgi:hypothetical protein
MIIAKGELMANLAPYGTPARMRVLAGVSVVGSVAMIVGGIADIATIDRGGVLLLALGAAYLLLSAIFIVGSRRTGKL